MSRLIISNKIELVIKQFPTYKVPSQMNQMASQLNYTKHLKES